MRQDIPLRKARSVTPPRRTGATRGTLVACALAATLATIALVPLLSAPVDGRRPDSRTPGSGPGREATRADPGLDEGLRRIAARTMLEMTPPTETAVVPPPVAVATIEPVDVPPSGDGIFATGSVSQPEPPKGKVVAGPDVEMACLPPGLMKAIGDVAGRFGDVAVVSTTRLHTDNHGAGRAKIHADCLAADIRTGAPARDVVAYLHGKAGIGGLQSFKNGVIHVDDPAAHPADAYDRAKGTDPAR